MSRWVDRFSGHAVSPEKAADKILAGVARNRFLIYTSADIRALYAFKRVAWWPYSVAMRQVNAVFTKALKPAPVGSPRYGAGICNSSRTPSSRTGRSSSNRSNTRNAAATMTPASMVGSSSLRIFVRV